MDKLPPTPPKPPPPSSSLIPSPSSLPPRPPPPQARPVISILPALPMAHHQKQKRKFPAQGIGRGGGLQGHASLPPKPGIPGKPLPRDTGPIVLTGGKDNIGSGNFSYSHVAKRTYSSAAMTKAESPPATRREPVMTALAPAPQPRASTSPIHHYKPPVATTITPPAEMVSQPFTTQVTSLMNYGSETNDVGAGSENQNSPKRNGVDSETSRGNDLAVSNSLAESTYPNIVRPEMISQHPNFLSFPPPNFYENSQENSFPPNRNFNHLNGHQTPMHNGPLSDGYSYVLPPPLLPNPHPHHMHLQHHHQQNQHHQGFIHRAPQDPYPFPNSMTPPNTGTMFAPPPPFQPRGVFDSSNQTSEMGGSTNPQTPFTPTHPFPVHLELQHHHPQHSVFPPPPLDHIIHFDTLHQGQHRQNTLEASLDPKSKQPSIIESNPLLRSISFFPPDSDQRNDTATKNAILPSNLSDSGRINHHDGISNDNEKYQLKSFESQVDISRSSSFATPENGLTAAHRLQSYSLGYYLNDRLADVSLSVKRIGGNFEWNSEDFSAHSFILGRSIKLARLIEDEIRGSEKRDVPNSISEATGRLSRSSSKTSWADEMENERKDDEHLFTGARIASSRKVTVLLETSDKYISRDSFLLTLRWLYGGADWELDAYLDPSHPKHRTLEWTRKSIEKTDGFQGSTTRELVTASPQNNCHQETDESIESCQVENIIQETKSEEVRMLERSIALLAAGTLLGVDEVIDKGGWGIRRWGMRFEGGAFERLLSFALEGSKEVDSNKAMANSAGEPRAIYGMFTKHLLDEAIAFLVKSLPYPFKFESRAPASNYLVRLPENHNHSPASIPAPMILVDTDLRGPAKLQEVYSTILLSVPFSLLRTILEHDGFATRTSDWKGIARYDIAKAVVHERERRRKYGFKVARERRASICSETTEAGTTDEYSPDQNVSPVGEKEGPEWENLYWEESVLCTFGHGGNGLEITRRRKGGGTGGRVLWKIGDTPMKI